MKKSQRRKQHTLQICYTAYGLGRSLLGRSLLGHSLLGRNLHFKTTLVPVVMSARDLELPPDILCRNIHLQTIYA